ncbi:MAG: DNA repair protein RecO [Proteobacteria bacterium]|nr:DNA repair protein RecO [Pseudomonadota bacterium]MCP4921890.1 DNA repair protein RecO [Pseudomonadota bacterium]
MARGTELTCIVVGHVDYGEADRIVHLATPEHGRIAALAKGARKSRKRFTGALDLGNRIQALVHRGRGELWLMNGATLEHGRPHIRNDLDRIALAAYACELVSSLMPAEHEAVKLYTLLDVALLTLDAMTGPPELLWRLGLEAKALTFAGFTPRLLLCDVCGLELSDPAVFAPDAGGARHGHCGGGQEVSVELLGAIEQARRTPLADLVDVTCPPGDRNILVELLRWHTGRELKSKGLVSDLGL